LYPKKIYQQIEQAFFKYFIGVPLFVGMEHPTDRGKIGCANLFRYQVQTKKTVERSEH
jgi:hypothetical protein